MLEEAYIASGEAHVEGRGGPKLPDKSQPWLASPVREPSSVELQHGTEAWPAHRAPSARQTGTQRKLLLLFQALSSGVAYHTATDNRYT